MNHKKLFIWQGYWQGGTGKITLALAHFLHTKGIDVTLGAYTRNNTVALPQIIFNEPKFLPPSFRSLYTSLIWNIKYGKHYNASYAHTLGLWKTRHGDSFIHDAADMDKKLLAAPSLLHKMVYFCWKTLYLHLSIKNATLLFATEDFSRFLTRNNIPDDKIVPSGSFYDDNVYIFHQRHTPQHPFSLVFVGDIDDRVKNIDYMIHNFYKHPDYIVDVLGGSKQGIDQNFIYHGYQNKNYIADILSKSHFFIMPSFSEGFSIALLEAAATGIPCLVHEHALPAELKNIASIIPFSLTDPIHIMLKNIAQEYEKHAQKSAIVTKYGQSNLLKKEYEILVRYLT